MVYWFDPHKGYSLHMEKLQRHSILVTIEVSLLDEGKNGGGGGGGEGYN